MSATGGSNILHLTPEQIAAWPAPDYENPDRLTWMPVYSGIWLAAATVMVAMRYWLRMRGYAGRLGLDDAILFPGWLAGVMFTTITIVYTERAQGDRHVWDAEPEQRSFLVLQMWLGQLSFLICGGCTKVSILLFYRRLVDGTYSKRWKWAVWFAIGFTIAYTIAFCVMLLTNCTPTEAYWMAFDVQYLLTKEFKCLDTTVINTLAGVCAAISDLYAVALPCIITWHFNIPKRQKIALNVIFSLGLVVVAASGIRTYWLITTGNSKDVTRAAFKLFVWAQFELQVGIICASAPSLRIFFRRYLGGTSGVRSTRNNTPGPDRTMLTNKSITVIRSTTVAFNEGPKDQHADKKLYPETHTIAETASDDAGYSPTRSQERLTRYSHEEDSFAMNDLSWKNPAGQRQTKWPGKI